MVFIKYDCVVVVIIEVSFFVDEFRGFETFETNSFAFLLVLGKVNYYVGDLSDVDWESLDYVLEGVSEVSM